ncbi:hypothetical protein J6590_065729 [Homalodisca vitripennis]|nr:hypothetical protein J6590_065729 [Homalodisca vitripennis]
MKEGRKCSVGVCECVVGECDLPQCKPLPSRKFSTAPRIRYSSMPTILLLAGTRFKMVLMVADKAD